MLGGYSFPFARIAGSLVKTKVSLSDQFQPQSYACLKLLDPIRMVSIWLKKVLNPHSSLGSDSGGGSQSTPPLLSAIKLSAEVAMKRMIFRLDCILLKFLIKLEIPCMSKNVKNSQIAGDLSIYQLISSFTGN